MSCGSTPRRSNPGRSTPGGRLRARVSGPAHSPGSTPSVARLSVAGTALLVLCALFAAALPAQESIIYRCTDAKGQLTLQNDTPCPAGSRQEIRRIGAVPTAPAPVQEAPRPAERRAPPTESNFVLVRGPVAAQGAPPDPARVRNPPPPLWECRDWQGERYFSDVETPPKACVPLNVVGIDGSQELAAGSACEMRTDACAPVPDTQLCQEWKRRVDEAEFRVRYGSGSTLAREREYARLREAWLATTCAP